MYLQTVLTLKSEMPELGRPAILPLLYTAKLLFISLVNVTQIGYLYSRFRVPGSRCKYGLKINVNH
jgi:hypothetical protein